MSAHYVNVCRWHDSVVMQCRCPGHKTKLVVDCPHPANLAKCLLIPLEWSDKEQKVVRRPCPRPQIGKPPHCGDSRCPYAHPYPDTDNESGGSMPKSPLEVLTEAKLAGYTNNAAMSTYEFRSNEQAAELAVKALNGAGYEIRVVPTFDAPDMPDEHHIEEAIVEAARKADAERRARLHKRTLIQVLSAMFDSEAITLKVKGTTSWIEILDPDAVVELTTGQYEAVKALIQQ